MQDTRRKKTKPTKDEARKWYADIKPIILCMDQGDNDKGVVLNLASKQDKQSGLFGSGWIGVSLKSLKKTVWVCFSLY